MRLTIRALSTVLPLCAVLACCGGGSKHPEADAGKPAPVRLKLATTTSTDSTGLLKVFLPPFEKAENVLVDVIAVGTGKALKLGETGDVDVVLVHAREAEDAFIDAGFGVNRRDVMHNDFVLVGPRDDPAGASSGKDAVEAFSRIAASGRPFVSRGDDSGTHKKERQLWKAAGLAPSGGWYMEAGQGMASTLIMAAEKDGYCLCDRASWLTFERKGGIELLFEKDPSLLNSYGIIAVNPARHGRARYMEAMKLIAWFTSREGQKIIGDFKKDGIVLFHPDAVPPEK